jgi:hypothetical protein
LALRGVGPESEAESVRFHGRRVTKVGPEVKHGLFRVAVRARNPKKLPPEGWGPLNKGWERRTRALPDVSAGGDATTGSVSWSGKGSSSHGSRVVSPGESVPEELWRFTSPRVPVLSGLAVANGVIYFNTSGSPSTLYALHAKTGEVLARVFTSGGISGPSVSNGQIYVGTGTLFASGFPTTTSIVAIGL